VSEVFPFVRQPDTRKEKKRKKRALPRRWKGEEKGPEGRGERRHSAVMATKPLAPSPGRRKKKRKEGEMAIISISKMGERGKGRGRPGIDPLASS